MIYEQSLKKETEFKGLTFMGIIFLLFGLGSIINGFSMIYNYIASSDWTRTPAEIIHVDLRTYINDGKRLYSLECMYSYDWNGVEYSGTRVGFDRYRSSDSYHRKRFSILKHHEKTGLAYPALVDPEHPDRSVLFRELQTTMLVFSIAGVLFFLIGIFLAGWGIQTWQKHMKLETVYRKRPWRAENIAGDFTVRDRSVSHIYKAFGAGIGLTLFVSLFYVMFFSQGNPPVIAIVVNGVFSICAVAIFAQAIYFTFRYIKYGASTLILSQLPLVPGRRFSGLIRTRAGIDASEGMQLTLKCLKVYYEGEGKKREQVKKVLYSDQMTIYKYSAEKKTLTWTFELDVPEGYPDYSVTGTTKYRWILEVQANTPGIDYFSSFDMPVYSLNSEIRVVYHPYFRQQF